VPPPPPISSIRHRSPKNKSLSATPPAQSTELDSAGRVDNAGKQVGFYPSTRGNPSKSQASAVRKGQRLAAKKAP
jgi:hypothetical protein